MKPERWVNTKEVAEHMGVTVETVRQWIKLEKCFAIALKNSGYSKLTNG